MGAPAAPVCGRACRNDSAGQQGARLPRLMVRRDTDAPGHGAVRRVPIERKCQAHANLKGRIAELRRIRDAASADAERAEASDRRAAEITPDILSRFAEAARKRIKTSRRHRSATRYAAKPNPATNMTANMTRRNTPSFTLPNSAIPSAVPAASAGRAKASSVTTFGGKL